ncbi:Helitron helicase [Phytophthora megakarya]|uniref:Helitron helicase n=1 Tax=Phytophthora megakarya TaxID=4795 RepID=A0A225UKE0_9STRA|nr:Helitron helicase [Phytophthora megakarya]
MAKFSEFLLQIGEGRYPVNDDIGEGDICLPHDKYAFPKPPEGRLNEDDETKPFPNYYLHPSVDDHNTRDLELMVHDAAPDSDNVRPEADDTGDDR